MDAHKTIQSVFHILGILVILGFLSLQAGSCMLLVGAMSAGDESPSTHKTAKDSFAFGDENAAATFLRVPVAGVISAEPDENVIGIRRASLLESVQVLATGQATRDVLSPGEGLPDLGAQYSTITLDVTPEQAQQLAVGLRMGELIPMLRGAEDDAPTGLDTLGDGRLACRGLVRDDGSAAASARRRLPVDVMVGGRPPARFARVWVSDSDI